MRAIRRGRLSFFTISVLLHILCIQPLFSSTSRSQPVPEAMKWQILMGNSGGLYGIDRFGIAVPLWTEGSVRKIIHNNTYWAILSDQGILISRDLVHWERRSEGLPVKTIKTYEGGRRSFIRLVQEIKDVEFHPENPDIIVCAVKDAVFLSRNAGLSWENLGMPAYRTNGIKAVAVADMSGNTGPELTVFLSHSTYGIHYLSAGRSGAAWLELNDGLERLETTNNPDEVSDIAAVLRGGGEGQAGGIAVYASQTFRSRLYQLDWEQKRFISLWHDGDGFGTTDSLNAGKRTIRFLREGSVYELAYGSGGASSILIKAPVYARDRRDIRDLIGDTVRKTGIKADCMVIRDSRLYPEGETVSLSELWLLDENPAGAEVPPSPLSREGLYLPVNHSLDAYSLSPYLNIIKERKLDMVVIDMKDDYGRLRFTPKNPGIAEKGRVFRPVDIDRFLADMKAQGIYTAARIVVFKDPELAKKEDGRFAVWDGRNNIPWKGYYDRRQRKNPEAGASAEPSRLVEILDSDDPDYEIVRTYYDETWVDPYSEDVWEYTAAVAKELHERGFDEIQFDYIRFPTDGQNLSDIQYRWKDAGMDMESAMLSFLRHIRASVDAPISIDIYGANGWYRTGARTGQEVELLAPYVDIICPMYYPSHFEQDFLAQPPEEMRPYRIYYQGTLRTARIARGQVTVRPYAQAFYLNVSYDRQYYNTDYVRRQTEGVRDAGGGGLTYWNNSGRYADIPFPGDFEKEFPSH